MEDILEDIIERMRNAKDQFGIDFSDLETVDSDEDGSSNEESSVDGTDNSGIDEAE